MRRVLGERGPAVLLLPGGAEPADGFYPGLAERLVEDPGCRVVLYDRPGTGTSRVDGRLAEASRAVHATLRELGAAPAVVVGQSLGGAVALLLAVDHPADVAGLVLLDPTPVDDPALARRIERTARTTGRLARLPGARRLLGALLAAGARRSARRHRMGPEHRAVLLAVAEVDLARLAAAAAGLEQVAQDFDVGRLPRVPAAVVTADRKAGHPVRRAHQRLAAALDAPLLAWPRAEHAVHLTHPEPVLRVCREVLDAVRSR